MTVEVIIPYAGHDEHRDRALAWVRKRWNETYGLDPMVAAYNSGPWCKAVPVRMALSCTDADTLVITDADVWVDNVDEYIDSVEAGRNRWACPHHRVFRFNEVGTQMIYDEDLHPVDVALRRGVIDESMYPRVLGGGLIILERDLYEEAPFDARFFGWGGEDQSWGLALATLGGRRHQGEEMLWHLWHPPAERLNRAVGTVESAQLVDRYKQATSNVDDMRALIEEGRRA